LFIVRSFFGKYLLLKRESKNNYQKMDIVSQYHKNHTTKTEDLISIKKEPL
jgi:hypothetical protein